MPLNNELDVVIFGGPSFVTVNQDLTTRVEFSEVFPFDTAQFTGMSTTTDSGSILGFNVGVDVSFYFSKHVGVGGLVRFSRASVEFTLPDGDATSANIGGLQTTGGLRVRF